MYHERKLILFISHIYGRYQSALSQGIIEQAASYGYRMEIFTSNDGEDLGDYALGESSLIDIPDYSQYAGVIFASNTYTSAVLRTQITERLKSLSGIPIVEINDIDPIFPAVRLENNETAGQLTAHLIREHGCKTICYLGCANEPFYSHRRRDAYLQAMKEHDLPVLPHFLCEIDESDASYAAAFAAFSKQGTNLPDAVVCYNDRLALRFWREALKRGIRIPEDLRITGCDDTEDSLAVHPGLTTVTYPVAQLGRKAMEALWHEIHALGALPDSTVTAEILLRGSCGCPHAAKADAFLYSQTLQEKLADLEKSIFLSVHMSSSLANARSLEEGMDILEQVLSGQELFSNFFLCLYPDWDRLSGRVRMLTGEELTEEEEAGRKYLAFGLQGGRRVAECTYSASLLLPEHVISDPGGTQVVTPLFFEERIFGYAVFAYRGGQVQFPFKVVQWVVIISQLLENLRERRNRHVLTEHLEEVYLKDVLTGLYNRHGFQRFSAEFLNGLQERDMVSLLFADVRSLREINDTYGHGEGDFALQTVGQALLSCAGEHAVCAKFNSGEFYVLIAGGPAEADGMMARIDAWLRRYNELGEKPYEISVRFGTSSCRRSLLMKASGMEVLMSAAQKQKTFTLLT